MSDPPLDRRKGAILTYVIAPTLCLLAPFVVFLSVNDYILPRVEVLIIFLWCLTLGVVSGGLQALNFRRLALAPIGFALVLSVSFITNVESTVSALGVVIALSAVTWVLRDHVATIVFVVSLLYIVSTLILPPPDVGRIAPSSIGISSGDRSAVSSADLPPILHLVLDEFVGVHGLPVEIPGATDLRDNLVNYFLDYRFEIHSHAYSEFSNTTNSLTNLFRLESSAKDYAMQGTSFTLNKNAYFEYLNDLGYAFNVYQTDYIDFCQTPSINYSSCQTYKADTARPLDAVDVAAVEKSKFLFNSFLTTSSFTRNLRDKYERIRKKSATGSLPAWRKFNRSTGPLTTNRSLADLNEALSEMQPANVYFAHLMMPHYPYAWRKDCSARPEPIHWLHRTPWEISHNTPNERVLRYQHYFEQLQCQQFKIDELFQSIVQSGMWESSIIIIHGDHGSRIVETYANVVNRNLLAAQDFLDTYSVFFAHKGIGHDGNIIREPQSLQELLAHVFPIRNLLANDDRIVYLGRGPEAHQVPEAHQLIGFGP